MIIYYWYILKNGDIRIAKNRFKKDNYVREFVEQIDNDTYKHTLTIWKKDKEFIKVIMTHTGYDRSVKRPRIIKQLLKGE